MSVNDESSSDEERNFEDDDDDDNEYSYDKRVLFSAVDQRLLDAVDFNDDAAVQQALRQGANVDVAFYDTNPLLAASQSGYDHIVRILLQAGADARWMNALGESAIYLACLYRRLSTFQLLINHDNGLLEITDNYGWTPLFRAIGPQHSDIVRFLLDTGADAHHVDRYGNTTLMCACQFDNLEIVRLLLAAGVDVEARNERQQTALHCAALSGRSEVVRELVLQHNANMCAVDRDGLTPFDLAADFSRSFAAANTLLEFYGNKISQDYGCIALHELLQVAAYSFAEDEEFHPPLNPLQIILPLGKLRLKHFRTLLHALDPELIRNRDDTGKLPIHIACQTNAPVEVLALILELDPTTIHIADNTGALPIHLLCGATSAATEYASVRYLVEQGGVAALAARDRQGLLPLHVLCRSTNPPLRAVQYLMQSFPGSVAMQSNAGQYPFMMAAAAESSSASLSVMYEIVRANPGVAVPR